MRTVLLWPDSAGGIVLSLALLLIGLLGAGFFGWVIFQAVLTSFRVSMAPLKLYDIDARMERIERLLAAVVAERRAPDLTGSPLVEQPQKRAVSERAPGFAVRRGWYERVPAWCTWSAAVGLVLIMLFIASR